MKLALLSLVGGFAQVFLLAYVWPRVWAWVRKGA